MEYREKLSRNISIIKHSEPLHECHLVVNGRNGFSQTKLWLKTVNRRKTRTSRIRAGCNVYWAVVFRRWTEPNHASLPAPLQHDQHQRVRRGDDDVHLQGHHGVARQRQVCGRDRWAGWVEWASWTGWRVDRCRCDCTVDHT